jgi:predicted permease
LRTIWSDVRFAVRRLRQQPGFTVVAVVTLALGLGANTAIFTLIHAVMMRPLPVTRPAELYRLGNTGECCVTSGLQTDFALFSYSLFQHLREQLPEFSELAAFQANTGLTAVRPPTGGPALSAPVAYVSGNYFRMLGVTASAGRLLDPSDDLPGATPVMVMSYATWAGQFGADPTLVGRAFVINGVAITLAGIAAPDFFGETVRPNPAGIWLPLGQEPLTQSGTGSLIARPQAHWLYAIGRLPAGRDASGLDGRATHALQTWLTSQSFLSERERGEIPRQRIVTTSAAAGVQMMRGNFGQSLTLLFVMSGVVLLIAAANLANLLLARADRAQAAIRAALGASAGRLVRQSLVEGIVLALAGCVGAFVVSMIATSAIVGLAFPSDAMLPVDVTPSRAIVLFSVTLAIVTGALFAAAPAWAMAGANPIDALRGMAREGADLTFLPRRSLVVVQVTLSLVLLVCAGLLSKSLSQLERQPLGFAGEHRLIVRFNPPRIANEPERLAAMYASMVERLERLPGVLRASYSLYSPMEGNNWSSDIAIAGRAIDPARPDGASWNRVGPNYFETMGTRVLRGRSITGADTPTSERVAVVNDAFARKFLAGRDPLGAQLGLGDASHANDYTIVGIVEDVKYANPSEPARPMIFFPTMQVPVSEATSGKPGQTRTLMRAIELHVAPSRGNLEPAIRRALADTHPDLAVMRIVPIEAQVAGNFNSSRLLATLASAYGLLALALASLGLYGVTTYGVNRRMHEIGVRMALGANQRRVVWSVLRGALVQTGVGLAIGIPLALAAGGALTAQLFDVNGRDPVVVVAAAAVLLVTAGLAAALPARRAASVDPTRALRAQ